MQRPLLCTGSTYISFYSTPGQKEIFLLHYSYVNYSDESHFSLNIHDYLEKYSVMIQLVATSLKLSFTRHILAVNIF